ncbi:MAG: hypothetical protein KIT17_24235, partial [Rubrivivax sp.]|nr:hypothetical protein [Rubrivivax sp.]
MARPAESVVDGSEAPRSDNEVHDDLAEAGPADTLVPDTPAEPKDLPAVDRLLRAPEVAPLIAEHGHTLVAAEARALLELRRARARA